MVVQEHLGSTIARAGRRELERVGRIIPVEYTMFAIGCQGNIQNADALDIAYDEWLVDNKELHDLTARLCKKYKGDGTLILVDRKKLGNSLEEALMAKGLAAKFICGDTSRRQRDIALRSFEKRSLDVLIGGKIINRGLDLDGGCENLVIGAGGKLKSEFLQKIGRAVRHNKLGKGRVLDFYFRCNKYLYRHSRERLRAMVEEGYKAVVVFPGGSIDGKQLVDRKFRVARKYLTRSGGKTKA